MADPAENAVLLAEPTHNTREARERTVQAAFESLRCVLCPMAAFVAGLPVVAAACCLWCCTMTRKRLPLPHLLLCLFT